MTHPPAHPAHAAADEDNQTSSSTQPPGSQACCCNMSATAAATTGTQEEHGNTHGLLQPGLAALTGMDAKPAPPGEGAFCVRLDRPQLTATVVQDMATAFPTAPSNITGVQGPVIEVQRVDSSTVDVRVVHSFTAHFPHPLLTVEDTRRRLAIHRQADGSEYCVWEPSSNGQAAQQVLLGQLLHRNAAHSGRSVYCDIHEHSSPVSSSASPRRGADPDDISRPVTSRQGAPSRGGAASQAEASGSAPVGPAVEGSSGTVFNPFGAMADLPPFSAGVAGGWGRYSRAAFPAGQANDKVVVDYAPVAVVGAGVHTVRSHPLTTPIIEEVTSMDSGTAPSEDRGTGSSSSTRGTAGEAAQGHQQQQQQHVVHPARSPFEAALALPAGEYVSLSTLQPSSNTVEQAPALPGQQQPDGSMQQTHADAAATMQQQQQKAELSLVPAGGPRQPTILVLKRQGSYGFKPRCEWEVDPSKVLVGRRLAVGGFAEVFLGKYEGTAVAVKRLLMLDGSTMERFISEVRILARLRHPNLILFMGYCTRPDLCIVSEYMNRGSLYTLLRQHERDHRQLDAKLQRIVAVSVARGMSYLHTRHPPILHLDLKSPNILVDDRWRVKITDFGLSRVRQATYVSASGLGGTPEWMAPEVLRCQDVAEPADVYSYGVVLWELLTGEAPWEGYNPMQVIGLVGYQHQVLPLPTQGDPFLVHLCELCMQQDPSKRPTFTQLVAMLDQQYGPSAWADTAQPLLQPRIPAVIPAATVFPAPQLPQLLLMPPKESSEAAAAGVQADGEGPQPGLTTAAPRSFGSTSTGSGADSTSAEQPVQLPQPFLGSTAVAGDQAQLTVGAKGPLEAGLADLPSTAGHCDLGPCQQATDQQAGNWLLSGPGADGTQQEQLQQQGRGPQGAPQDLVVSAAVPSASVPDISLHAAAVQRVGGPDGRSPASPSSTPQLAAASPFAAAAAQVQEAGAEPASHPVACSPCASTPTEGLPWADGHAIAAACSAPAAAVGPATVGGSGLAPVGAAGHPQSASHHHPEQHQVHQGGDIADTWGSALSLCRPSKEGSHESLSALRAATPAALRGSRSSDAGRDGADHLVLPAAAVPAAAPPANPLAAAANGPDGSLRRGSAGGSTASKQPSTASGTGWTEPSLGHSLWPSFTDSQGLRSSSSNGSSTSSASQVAPAGSAPDALLMCDRPAAHAGVSDMGSSGPAPVSAPTVEGSAACVSAPRDGSGDTPQQVQPAAPQELHGSVSAAAVATSAAAPFTQLPLPATSSAAAPAGTASPSVGAAAASPQEHCFTSMTSHPVSMLDVLQQQQFLLHTMLHQQQAAQQQQQQWQAAACGLPTSAGMQLPQVVYSSIATVPRPMLHQQQSSGPCAAAAGGAHVPPAAAAAAAAAGAEAGQRHGVPSPAECASAPCTDTMSCAGVAPATAAAGAAGGSMSAGPMLPPSCPSSKGVSLVPPAYVSSVPQHAVALPAAEFLVAGGANQPVSHSGLSVPVHASYAAAAASTLAQLGVSSSGGPLRALDPAGIAAAAVQPLAPHSTAGASATGMPASAPPTYAYLGPHPALGGLVMGTPVWGHPVQLGGSYSYSAPAAALLHGVQQPPVHHPGWQHLQHQPQACVAGPPIAQQYSQLPLQHPFPASAPLPAMASAQVQPRTPPHACQDGLPALVSDESLKCLSPCSPRPAGLQQQQCSSSTGASTPGSLRVSVNALDATTVGATTESTAGSAAAAAGAYVLQAMGLSPSHGRVLAAAPLMGPAAGLVPLAGSVQAAGLPNLRINVPPRMSSASPTPAALSPSSACSSSRSYRKGRFNVTLSHGGSSSAYNLGSLTAHEGLEEASTVGVVHQNVLVSASCSQLSNLPRRAAVSDPGSSCTSASAAPQPLSAGQPHAGAPALGSVPPPLVSAISWPEVRPSTPGAGSAILEPCVSSPGLLGGVLEQRAGTPGLPTISSSSSLTGLPGSAPRTAKKPPLGRPSHSSSGGGAAGPRCASNPGVSSEPPAASGGVAAGALASVAGAASEASRLPDRGQAAPFSGCSSAASSRRTSIEASPTAAAAVQHAHAAAAAAPPPPAADSECHILVSSLSGRRRPDAPVRHVSFGGNAAEGAAVGPPPTGPIVCVPQHAAVKPLFERRAAAPVMPLVPPVPSRTPSGQLSAGGAPGTASDSDGMRMMFRSISGPASVDRGSADPSGGSAGGTAGPSILQQKDYTCGRFHVHEALVAGGVKKGADSSAPPPTPVVGAASGSATTLGSPAGTAASTALAPTSSGLAAVEGHPGPPPAACSIHGSLIGTAAARHLHALDQFLSGPVACASISAGGACYQDTPGAPCGPGGQLAATVGASFASPQLYAGPVPGSCLPSTSVAGQPAQLPMRAARSSSGGSSTSSVQGGSVPATTPPSPQLQLSSSSLAGSSGSCSLAATPGTGGGAPAVFNFKVGRFTVREEHGSHCPSAASSRPNSPRTLEAERSLSKLGSGKQQGSSCAGAATHLAAVGHCKTVPSHATLHAAAAPAATATPPCAASSCNTSGAPSRGSTSRPLTPRRSGAGAAAGGGADAAAPTAAAVCRQVGRFVVTQHMAPKPSTVPSPTADPSQAPAAAAAAAPPPLAPDTVTPVANAPCSSAVDSMLRCAVCSTPNCLPASSRAPDVAVSSSAAIAPAAGLPLPVNPGGVGDQASGANQAAAVEPPLMAAAAPSAAQLQPVAAGIVPLAAAGVDGDSRGGSVTGATSCLVRCGSCGNPLHSCAPAGEWVGVPAISLPGATTAAAAAVAAVSCSQPWVPVPAQLSAVVSGAPATGPSHSSQLPERLAVQAAAAVPAGLLAEAASRVLQLRALASQQQGADQVGLAGGSDHSCSSPYCTPSQGTSPVALLPGAVSASGAVRAQQVQLRDMLPAPPQHRSWAAASAAAARGALPPGEGWREPVRPRTAGLPAAGHASAAGAAAAGLGPTGVVLPGAAPAPVHPSAAIAAEVRAVLRHSEDGSEGNRTCPSPQPSPAAAAPPAGGSSGGHTMSCAGHSAPGCLTTGIPLQHKEVRSFPLSLEALLDISSQCSTGSLCSTPVSSRFSSLAPVTSASGLLAPTTTPLAAAATAAGRVECQGCSEVVPPSCARRLLAADDKVAAAAGPAAAITAVAVAAPTDVGPAQPAGHPPAAADAHHGGCDLESGHHGSPCHSSSPAAGSRSGVFKSSAGGGPKSEGWVGGSRGGTPRSDMAAEVPGSDVGTPRSDQISRRGSATPC